jgi:hypothetical protein
LKLTDCNGEWPLYYSFLLFQTNQPSIGQYPGLGVIHFIAHLFP